MIQSLKEKYFPTLHWQNPFSGLLIGNLQCGLFGWHPKWLQKLKTIKVFMICYIILTIFHGMYSAYLSVVIPSIERRFGFTSRQMGTVRSMSDCSRIIASLIIAHYGGAGHRPRWISGGSILLGIGMFIMASPEYFFPPTKSSLVTAMISSADDSNEVFCRTNKKLLSTLVANSTQNCSAKHHVDNALYPMIVLGFSEFIMGLGATSINVSYRNSPLYFAVSICGKALGPILGYYLGAACSAVFFDFSHPNLSPTDPRWVSAWYLGLIVTGSGVIFFGILMGCFPSVLRESSESSKDFKEFDAKRRQSLIRKRTTFKDFPRNLKRIFTNLPFVVKLVSQLMEALVISGYMSFMQKFIKEQYRVSLTTASLAAGVPGILVASVGILVGGLIIKRWKLEPGHVSLMTSFAAIIGSASYFIIIAFGCEQLNISGIDDVKNPHDITGNNDYCFNQMNCACSNEQFNPVCDLNTGRTFLSACVAGCLSVEKINGTKHYANCLCLNSSLHWNESLSSAPLPTTASSHVIPGLCQKSCYNFIPYVIVMCVAKFFLGMPIAGVLMMQFRLVDYDLKSLANGVSSVTMSLFGFLPAPIIAGAIIDTTCRFWQQTVCGDKGSCLLYNAQDFRWKLHIIVGFFKLVTCGMDLWITWLVWDMKFDRELTSGGTGLDTLEPATSVSTLTSSDTISQKSEVPASETEDYFDANGVSSRRYSTPRKSIVETLADSVNANSFIEEHDDTQFVPTIAIEARRGSLLFE